MLRYLFNQLSIMPQISEPVERSVTSLQVFAHPMLGSDCLDAQFYRKRGIYAHAGDLKLAGDHADAEPRCRYGEFLQSGDPMSGTNVLHYWRLAADPDHTKAQMRYAHLCHDIRHELRLPCNSSSSELQPKSSDDLSCITTVDGFGCVRIHHIFVHDFLSLHLKVPTIS